MDTNVQKMNDKLLDKTHNVISIETLEKKLGTRKIDFSKKDSLDEALQTYFRMILKNQSVKFKNVINVRVLGSINTIAIEKEKSLSWLSSNENNKLAIRNNLGLISTSDNSIVDMINNTINDTDNIKQTDVVDSILDKLEGFSREDINSVLNGTISNAQYVDSGKLQLLLPKFYVSCHSIFTKLVQIISDYYNINVIFLMLSVASKDRSMDRLNPVILSTMDPARQTLGININLQGLHPLVKRKELESNKIVFEYINELDYTNDKINRLLSTDISENIIKEHSSELTRALTNKNIDIGNEIEFEPFDRELDLKVVEITVNGHKRSFLLGSTYNLYEDDDDKNNLVGKIKNWDTTDFNAEIYWCSGYLEKLDN